MGEQLIKKYNIKLSDDKTKLKVDGKIGKSSKDTEWLKAHKQEVIDILLEREAKEEAAREAYRKKLEAIEGLKELQTCISDWSDYNNAMSRFIDRDCTGAAPVKPAKTVDELKEQYPRAAAYIKADNWSYSAHFYKAMLGERSKKKILDGGNYKTVISDMKAAWKEYTDEHAFD